QDLAARIRSSPLREHLVAALDDWAWTAVDRREKSLKLTQRLLEVARQADPSPWTDQLRDTRLWLDRPALTKLTAEAPVERLSPSMLTLVSQLLRSNDLDAAAWLRRAQFLHPTDFWITFYLASAVWKDSEPDEAAAYFRAALAIRPRSSAALTNLGRIL